MGNFEIYRAEKNENLSKLIKEKLQLQKQSPLCQTIRSVLPDSNKEPNKTKSVSPKLVVEPGSYNKFRDSSNSQVEDREEVKSKKSENHSLKFPSKDGAWLHTWNKEKMSAQ